ncbi:AI-2E family transporter [Dictyobacter kobayashii]|uniref:AI-2E family transporter n=1 Tax=Dictyobacter kobayashii TaxID=2014872 RepID=A0A402AE09_9CHLR|nr:AI-2E family transporter [Dictyobacter kobayashii]GCE17331.1 AI-2E family transporter [Dictyobacter kobayashii]
MSSLSDSNALPRDNKTPNTVWTRRFLIALTIVAWMIILAGVGMVLNKILGPLITLGISALIAYVIYPLVRLLERLIPRPLAILIVYLGVLVLLILLVYFVVLTAIGQLATLIVSIQKSLPDLLERLQPFINKLSSVNISPNQILTSGEQVLNYALSVVGNVVPIVSSIFVLIINIIIITSLSVYFLMVGNKTVDWLREGTPLHWRGKMNFFLDTLNNTMGGFVRGQITLAAIISTIMWIGYTIIGVPYAMLLAIIIFVFEFIPQIGSYISISIAILLTFITKGWQTGLIVIAFSSIVQGGLDGQVLAPRILGHAVGIHPIISITALLIGAELFGLLGALFAAPIAGIIQIFVLAYWHSWVKQHPEEFPEKFDGQTTGPMTNPSGISPGVEPT